MSTSDRSDHRYISTGGHLAFFVSSSTALAADVSSSALSPLHPSALQNPKTFLNHSSSACVKRTLFSCAAVSNAYRRFTRDSLRFILPQFPAGCVASRLPVGGRMPLVLWTPAAVDSGW